jgi:hypothetical protein
MDVTFLSDEVINSTELRNNQKKWLDKAYVSPITIISGDKKLVILNRDHARQVYSLAHYTEIIIHLYAQLAIYMSSEEEDEFHREFLTAYVKALESQDWSGVDELLEDWKATINVARNSKLAKALSEKEDPSSYVRDSK